MKIHRFLAISLVACLAAALMAPGSGALAKAKKKSGPVVVATDPADDWGANVDPNIAPAGAPLGMELVEAAIGLSEDKTAINFILKLGGSSGGGVPELVRWGWEFSVDGNAYQLNGGGTSLFSANGKPIINHTIRKASRRETM